MVVQYYVDFVESTASAHNELFFSGEFSFRCFGIIYKNLK